MDGPERTTRTAYAVLTAVVLAVAVMGIAVTQVARAQAPVTSMSEQGIPQGCSPAWYVVPSQDVGVGENSLYSVAAIGPNDVWAVGSYTGTGRYLTLIEHWDGGQWSIVPSPDPGGYNNFLVGVSAVAPDDVWAVGSYNNDPYYSTHHLLTIHWDGSQWNEVPNPDPGGNYENYLSAVDARASDDVWAVGFYREYSPLSLVMHWDGSAWSDPGLSGVSGAVLDGVKDLAANNVWAVGYNGFQSRALILHYDGSTWTEVPSAAPDSGVHLYGVDGVAANDIWAVGSQVEHWDGNTWSVVTAPGAGTLQGVKAISSTDVWAAGSSAFLHWDGTVWSLVASPASGNLRGIDAVATDDVWAVGSQIAGGMGRTLTEHYTSGCITPSSTPTLTPTGTPTNTATGTSTATNTPTETPTGTQSPQATVTATATACTIEFTDVPVGSTFYAYVGCLACRGIVQGYDCGGPGEPCDPNSDPYFRPGNDVTRGQFAKIAANAAGFNEPTGAQQYEDVASGSTFFDYVWRLTDRGYVTGYPCGGVGEPCGPDNLPYFRPNANVTRGQLSKIDANAAGLSQPPGAQQYEDVLPGSTFYDYIWRLTDLGVMSGYPCGGGGEPCGPGNLPYFRPGANATRGQASKIVANTFFPSCNP